MEHDSTTDNTGKYRRPLLWPTLAVSLTVLALVVGVGHTGIASGLKTAIVSNSPAFQQVVKDNAWLKVDLDTCKEELRTSIPPSALSSQREYYDETLAILASNSSDQRAVYLPKGAFTAAEKAVVEDHLVKPLFADAPLSYGDPRIVIINKHAPRPPDDLVVGVDPASRWLYSLVIWTSDGEWRGYGTVQSAGGPPDRWEDVKRRYQGYL